MWKALHSSPVLPQVNCNYFYPKVLPQHTPWRKLININLGQDLDIEATRAVEVLYLDTFVGLTPVKDRKLQ
jgi:hypothetical protein